MKSVNTIRPDLYSDTNHLTVPPPVKPERLVESTVEDEMTEEIVFSVKESPEGGYEAKALSAPIFTEADNLEELRSAVRDATECHFEKGKRPKLIRLHFVRDEIIAV